MEADKNTTPIAGHYLDALIATQQTLQKSQCAKAQILSKDFKGIDLNADEHRVMMTLFSMYRDEPDGYSETTFRRGVTITAYELCKRMDFAVGRNGHIGGRDIQQAIKALIGLRKKTFTVYFPKFTRMDRKGQKYYDVVVIPNCSLLEIVYEASDVTENELLRGDFEKKASKIHIRILYSFFGQTYFALFQSNFYSKLKSNLPTGRVSKYHFNIGLWLLKQTRRLRSTSRRLVEINVDKLIPILKIPYDANHMSRARKLVRKLYADLKLIGHLQHYDVDVKTRNGGTKDVLYI